GVRQRFNNPWLNDTAVFAPPVPPEHAGREIRGQPEFDPRGGAEHERLDEREAKAGATLMRRQQRGQPFRLAVGRYQRVIGFDGSGTVGPAPRVRIADDAARGTGLDFDEEQSLRGEDERVDLVDVAVIRDELEIGPQADRLLTGEVLRQELEGVTLPWVRGVG